jgi:primosomal protein N' (replication factor Y)
MKNIAFYVDVILPLPVHGLFTYSIDNDVEVGQRVVVQFGVRKIYTAIVAKLHINNPNNNYRIKKVIAIIDEPPIISSTQLKLWHWIASYYMCNIGEVMNAALPSSLKLASETKIIFHEEFDADIDGLNHDEMVVVNALIDRKELSIQELSRIISVSNILACINNLIQKNVLQIQENLYEKFKEKRVRYLVLKASEDDINNMVLTKKQSLFLHEYKSLVFKYPKKKWMVAEFIKRTSYSRGILNALVRKNVFEIVEENISRLLKDINTDKTAKKLVDFQLKALDNIKNAFAEKDVCLLHGVTSSGKTEIYIKLIQEQLQQGKQVLYLLPEIALTTQIIKRLQGVFGDRVGVSHSNLNNSERVEIFKSIQGNTSAHNYDIILGARSSLFLPFKDLGLVLIDEEHDSSFKQHQPAPRYHARDTAIYLANLYKAKVLLGSATPSAESYYNALQKKYSLVEINERYADISMPKIDIIDIRKSHLKKKMVAQFDPIMIDAIQQTLDNGKQVILFQNQRGYSPYLICHNCSFSSVCKQCDVSLTYHKSNHHLRCHYCGYVENVPLVCPSCSSKELSNKGFGTEQILDNIQELFPENIIKRMDYDTTRKKNAYKTIIQDFETGKIDILVGTQMIAKGLDFDNVALVGVMNADSLFRFPDFRSYERGFSLIMQVAGRAGRKDKQGQVLIQTYDEENYAFGLLQKHDYKSFIAEQIRERKAFNYPPYNRLIMVTLKHKKNHYLDTCSDRLVLRLRKSFGSRVLGPEYPYISRIRNYYNKNILLKIEKEASLKKAKEILKTILDTFKDSQDDKSLRIIVDIDPI